MRMNHDELALRALDAGYSFMVVFYKAQANAEELWFTEYFHSITDVWDAQRFWKRKSRGSYSAKRIYDLKELNSA